VLAINPAANTPQELHSIASPEARNNESPSERHAELLLTAIALLQGTDG